MTIKHKKDCNEYNHIKKVSEKNKTGFSDYKAQKRNKVAFVVYKAQKRAKGEAVLREIQLQTALEGNVTMQIWLGKQYLGQNDKTVVKHEGEINLNDARQRLIDKLTEKKGK